MQEAVFSRDVKPASSGRGKTDTECWLRSPRLPRRPGRWLHGRSARPQARTPTAAGRRAGQTHSGVKCMASQKPPSRLTALHGSCTAPRPRQPEGRQHVNVHQPPLLTLKPQLHSGSRSKPAGAGPALHPRWVHRGGRGPGHHPRGRCDTAGCPWPVPGLILLPVGTCPGARPGGDQVSQARGEACRLPTGNQRSAGQGQVHDRTSREGHKFRNTP